MNFSLLDDTDVSQAFATHLRDLRKQAKLSREALAQRSCVPASTIKKFELTGQISFRQLLLLWQSLDSLDRLYQLTQANPDRSALPTSIEEVLKDEL
ncbi:XRE family transcriptional regulator [Alginatibacterium sediminis]|uniref:XRE family transcriptional regulator n=1 Tax=Alginatibacterium sediminis TaxID=2164068 RepID=A0A420ENF2_9ALTE|nr:helix-turn-helix transcriptional regulator [Alginatibacterium sediminis]RKF22124.1 XRE family transcriptional regulator [Alginatibacterium sediminis]